MIHESDIVNTSVVQESATDYAKENVELTNIEEDVTTRNAIVKESDKTRNENEDGNEHGNGNKMINDAEALEAEIKLMIERNRKYLALARDSKPLGESNARKGIKPLRRAITKYSNISKNDKLKERLKIGKEMGNEMLNEISARRKENQKKIEERRAKRIESEIRVGKMTVIKDISKIRKCEKKIKDKLYKLPNEVINRLLKKK